MSRESNDGLFLHRASFDGFGRRLAAFGLVEFGFGWLEQVGFPVPGYRAFYRKIFSNAISHNGNDSLRELFNPGSKPRRTLFKCFCLDADKSPAAFYSLDGYGRKSTGKLADQNACGDF